MFAVVRFCRLWVWIGPEPTYAESIVNENLPSSIAHKYYCKRPISIADRNPSEADFYQLATKKEIVQLDIAK